MKNRIFKKTLLCALSFIIVCNLYADDKKVALIWGNANYKGQWEMLPVVTNDANTINKKLYVVRL